MNEPAAGQQIESASKAGGIARAVLKWAILGLLAFTCIMAAVRKFGG
jgi:hypothetical protein